MGTVTFDGVGKVYPDGTRAVADLELDVADGEFMILVGPSGCGKTTALRMVAGLEKITEGEIRIADKVVNSLEPRRRDIAMVFQNYALYPHMTVAENIGFGLKMHGLPRTEVKRRVEEIAGTLDLKDLLTRKPRALSGGQRQRVAMGRAIVREPAAFLMDEPLSNLDAKLRVQMRAEISRIQRQLRTTTIYVTHDQIEAMTMGDRVAVMRKGRLQQVDVPQQLYDHPANLFVASFIGSPSMNLVRAEVVRDGSGGLACRFAGRDLSLPPELVAARPVIHSYLGRDVALGLRPESIRDASLEPAAPPNRRLHGRVATTEALGFEQLVHVEIAAVPVVTAEVMEIAADVDATAVGELEAEQREHRAVLVGRFPTGLRLALGDEVDLVVDCTKLHLFDLDSGAAIGG
jgi:multiple sugar transport system ATP-binding protein